MEEIISQTSQLIQQSSQLLNHPVIGSAISGLVSWLGNKMGKSSAIEKLKQFEEDNYTDETVAGFEAQLEFILDENEDLQKELAEKVNEVEKIMVKEGMTIKAKTNTMNVTGNKNISFQDVKSKGNINISK